MTVTNQPAIPSANGSAARKIPLAQEKAVAILSRDLAYELDVVPLSFENNLLIVGMEDPAEKAVVEKIQQQTRTEVHGQAMPVRTIREGLSLVYPPVVRRETSTEIAALFHKIVKAALTHHATDIHIEPIGTKKGAVRLRLDDIPTTFEEFDYETLRRLVAYIKVQSGIDISELIRPLDGGLDIIVDGRHVRMRVSVITGIRGQKAALRILGNFELLKSLTELRMTPALVERLKRGVTRAGCFLVIAGPTGSGKTTLLYSLLRELNLRAINVYTVEDPVEIPVDAITQVEVNTKAEITFANATRGFVRQDPDLLVIGELRDNETVTECLAASTIGLSLLTTTHAKSAVHIVDRIVELGGQRSRVAATMTMGIAQRLVRRLCRHCKETAELSEQAEALRARFYPETGTQRVAKANGCPQCLSGYSGRFSVIEVLDITPELQVVMNQKNCSPIDIAHTATKNDYRPMVIDGLRHVLAGETSEDELLRKLAYEDLIL